MSQRDDLDSQAAADRELLEQLESLATLMNEQNPDLAAIVIGAALRLKELTSAPAESEGGLLIGNAAIARMNVDCCGKPQGCTNPTDGCIYKTHPFKRHLYRQG